MPPIYIEGVENIAITGEGIFDDNGDAWQISMKNVRVFSKVLPVIKIYNAVNVFITNFTCQDDTSGLIEITGKNYSNITLQNISCQREK